MFLYALDGSKVTAYNVRVMTKLFNPFFIYIYSFGFSLILYELGWSNLFPNLSTTLKLFFISTFIISLMLGWHIYRCRHSFFSNPLVVDIKDTRIIKCLLFFYVLEFIYARRIPLFSIFTDSDKFIHFGGIPTFHVLLVTYNVFFAVFLFHKLLCSYNKKVLLYCILISIIPPLLMVNRGMLLTIIFSCCFVFLFSLKQLIFKKIICCVFAVCVALYAFAIIGSARIQDTEDGRVFTAFTQPTDRFESLGISHFILWPYMYIASPIGNLQTCIDEYAPKESFSAFFLKCVCPDFIAEHIVALKENPTDGNLPLISPVFNTSTMYYVAYAQLGYLGMFALFIIQVFIIYVIFLSTTPRRNPFYTTTTSLASTVVVLNAFTNMWVFSAISFPIVWGFVSYYCTKLKW